VTCLPGKRGRKAISFFLPSEREGGGSPREEEKKRVIGSVNRNPLDVLRGGKDRKGRKKTVPPLVFRFEKGGGNEKALGKEGEEFARALPPLKAEKEEKVIRTRLLHRTQRRRKGREKKRPDERREKEGG